MATQGQLTSMLFDTTTAAYETSYIADTSITAPTVVYLNADYWYPSGYNYAVT